jgi:hypothetical protein
MPIGGPHSFSGLTIVRLRCARASSWEDSQD